VAEVKALKVKMAAVTASFRYPRIQVGRLPTFDMPPPATVYGHLAGVIGEWFEPEGLEYSCVFQHAGKGTDLETSQPIAKGSGRATASYRRLGWDYPVNVECEPTPQRREFLLHPRMTLYLGGPEGLLQRLGNAFVSPVFAYVLGRSQDLAACLSVEFAELAESEEAYFSHTLLPYDWRPWIVPGISVYMPSAIDYRRQRQAVQERYVEVTWPPLRVYSGTRDSINRSALPARFLVDEGDRREFSDCILPRGVWFLPVKGPCRETT
jgi:CRISPR-associated protein Cas5t